MRTGMVPGPLEPVPCRDGSPNRLKSKTMSMLYDRTADVVRKVFDARLSGPPVLDASEHFPDGARFVAHWQELRDEALAARRRDPAIPRFHELMAAQGDLSDNDDRDWRILVLQAYGARIERNRALCPKLAALVDSSPDVLSAALSYLDPHKHIPPHRGPFRGVMRFHLFLDVPLAEDGLPASIMTVDGKAYRLGSGESLLWDDTFEHEVLNDSDQPRTALLLDVRRRDMPLDMKLLSSVVIGVVRASVALREV